MATTLLVERLARYVNPWVVLGIRRTRMSGVRMDDFVSECERDSAYHHARIRHFASMLGAGGRVEPLEVDCMCERGRVFAVPILLDGHHRLAAGILVGAKRLPVEFGGRVDLLAYLSGRRKTPPED